METLKVKNLGPIASADIEFGDLTLFVGPQASGKSILLQLIKLMIDKKYIRKTLEQFGFVWSNKENAVLDRYFGEGMAGIWTVETEILFDKKPYSKSDILPKKREVISTAVEQLFYVPAQRVVCFQNGWPRYFTLFEDTVPYILREFSEVLRQQSESFLAIKSGQVFPQEQRLKAPLRDSFNDSIFHNGKIIIDAADKKQFKLNIGEASIPFMAWSAGQKEFMPLLLSFYWLCPASKASTKDDIKYVIIEEPEMGLHPQAIKSVILQVVDLMSRGYKVIISTHSPVVLEFAWAFKAMQESGLKDNVLFELFDLKKSAPFTRIFKDMFKKKINTYFFDRDSDYVHVKNISTLDAGSEYTSISEWGGLSSFSARAADMVLKAALNEQSN